MDRCKDLSCSSGYLDQDNVSFFSALPFCACMDDLHVLAARLLITACQQGGILSVVFAEIHASRALGLQ